MPADVPTILGTSGGWVPGARIWFQVCPLTEYAVQLAQVSGRRPRVCFVATATGDSLFAITSFYDAARYAGYEASHLALFPMPNCPTCGSVPHHTGSVIQFDSSPVWVRLTVDIQASPDA